MHCRACVPPSIHDRMRIKTHLAQHHNKDDQIDGLKDKATRVSLKKEPSIVHNFSFVPVERLVQGAGGHRLHAGSSETKRKLSSIRKESVECYH